jgi:hypothetical protein
VSIDFDREIAIIKMARTLRQIELAKARKKNPKDGDGDGFTTNPVTGKDDMPVAVAAAMAAAGRSAKKVTAKKVTAKKVTAKKVPAKKVPAKKVPAKKVPAKAKSTGVRVKNPETIDAQSIKTARSNPLFKPLFGPLPKEPEVGPGSFRDFRSAHSKRKEEWDAYLASIGRSRKSGGTTLWRRFVPAGHKRGQMEAPNGEYTAGAEMRLNEVGIIGEMLVTENPEIRRLVANWLGTTEISPSEAANLQHGRVSNSTYDAYSGAYGIEIKTTNITAQEGRFKVPEMSRKLIKGKKAGFRPAVVIVVADQKSGRIWIYGAKDEKVALDGQHTYSKIDLIGPKTGIYVGQDMMYSAWAYGLTPKPIRVGGDGETVKYDKTKKKAVITGKPGTQYGSESKEISIQTLTDQPISGDGKFR